jgi:anti-anti-sigma factor
MPQNPDVGDLQITPSDDDRSLLTITGEVDAHTCGRLKAALDELLGSAGDAPDLVVDMTGVTFLDSSGLRVLIGAYKEAEERGGRLRLRSPSDGVVRLLEITGLADRFIAE